MDSILYIYGIGILLWIYSLISVLMNEFKSGSTKIVWILVLIFLPVSCILYPFLKDGQVKDRENTMNWEDILMWGSVFVGMLIGSFFIIIVSKHYHIQLNSFFKVILIIISGFLFMSIIAAVTGLLQGFFGRNKNFKDIIKNANSGIASDQNKLGVMYLDGNYVEKDLIQAIYWFEAAAEQNNAWSLYNLGNMYYEGQHFNQNYSKAHELYLKAANLNHSHAQNKLGIMYNNGYGVIIDNDIAFSWFVKSANNGFDWGQSNLAGMYLNGRGINQDYQKAYELYKKAADQNNETAIVELAKMYIRGDGLTRNVEYAKELLSSLYEKGNKDAIALWQQYALDHF